MATAVSHHAFDLPSTSPLRRSLTHRWWLDFLTRNEFQSGQWYAIASLWEDFLQFRVPLAPLSYTLWWADLQNNLLIGYQFSTKGSDGLGSIRIIDQDQLYHNFHQLYPLRS